MQTGRCKLCKQENQQLCDSHYLPKKVYGVTRAPQLTSPHPIALGGADMKQSSDQLRDYVLCRSCEDRINKNGERWVLANIPQDYDAPFPLRTALEALRPAIVTKDVDLYDITGVRAFDIDKLLYFAVSIFWRGAIHDWETADGLRCPPVELCGYEEPIRKFLMGEQQLANDVVVTVDIWYAKKVLQAAVTPQASHLPECQRYWFYVPGIIFSIYLGQGIPSGVRRRNASNNVVCVDAPEVRSIWEVTKSMLESQRVTPKTRLMLNEVAAIRKKAAPAEGRGEAP